MHNVEHNDEIVAFGSGGGGSAGQARVRRQAGGGTSAAVGRAIGRATGLNTNLARRVNNLARAGRGTIRGTTGRRITRVLRAPTGGR